MGWIALLSSIVAVLLIVQFLLSRRSVQSEDDVSLSCSYRKRESIFTPAERSFYGVLLQAVGNHAVTLAKVRVADVISPEKGLSKGDWQRAFNKISRKHFDFLLCKTEDLSAVCAIELDDKTHLENKRQERDLFMDEICRTAKIPLIHVPVKSGYIVAEIREMIAGHIDLPKEKACPKCGSPMVIRTAKKGPHAGKQFWACSTFPKCRTTVQISADPVSNQVVPGVDDAVEAIERIPTE